MFYLRITSFFVLLFCSSLTYAGAEDHEPQEQISPWYLDTGIRYWLGQSKFVFNLFDIVGDTLLSRLTYQDVATNTAEGFWRLNHQGGIFFKGNVGGGSNIGGEFLDEDFPPALDIYSRTQSHQNYGRLNYVTFDFGYDIYQHDRTKVGPFIGYNYWFTRYHGMGCKQIAANPDVCSDYTFSNTTDTLNDEAAWNSLRLGINAELQISENLNFVLDAAYLYAYLLGHDFHNLRPDIRGEFFEGVGHGLQLDMAFNWFATPNFSMGIGARWWDIKTTGYAHFEESAVQGRPQYMDTSQKNYGLIVQSQYRFDDDKNRFKFADKDRPSNTPLSWDGLYLGANVGYGMSFNNVSVLPFESTSPAIADFSPLLIHLQSSGFLGGIQAGYNWTHNTLLWGIEADMDYASVGGTNSITFTPAPYFINNSVTQQLNWFGTLRAKLGKVVSNTLLPYVTVGFSLANTELAYDQTVLLGNTPVLQNTSSNTQTTLNWVSGAGLEYAVSDHVSYKLEYLYLKLGELSLDTAAYYGLNSDFTSNVLRLGINYHF
jgi:opacity protein-like surface antigen